MLAPDRIAFDPNLMAGRACIRSMCINIALVANLVASGMGADQILVAYPLCNLGIAPEANAPLHGRPGVRLGCRRPTAADAVWQIPYAATMGPLRTGGVRSGRRPRGACHAE